MISQTVEYALRAIVTIAQHDGQPCTAQQISKITQVPAPYLSKLMQGLVRAGLTSSQRGLHGGFVLTKSPAELTIWEVVDAVEPFKRIHECPLGITSHGSTLCPLHRRLDSAMAMVEEQFRGATIADVLAEPGTVTPLCQEQRTMMIDTNITAQKRASTKSSKKNTNKNKKK
ncbi:MAG: RrF2 family transcriptional regulator [Bythopirellula sp.]